MKTGNRKSLILGAVLLLGIGILVIRTIQKELAGQNLWETLRQADWGWLLCGVLCMAVFVMAEAVNIRQALKLSGYSVALRQSVQYALAGFFFSSVTPSASGGQPAQLYYMNRDGIRISHGTFALFGNLLTFEIASILWGVFGWGYLLGSGKLRIQQNILWIFVVGLTLNLVVFAFLFCMMFSRKAAGSILKAGFLITEKLLKKPEMKKKLLYMVAEYRMAAKKLRKNKRVPLRILIVSLIQMTATHTIPFLCCKAVGVVDVQWLTAACTQGLLYISVSALPMPGAAGVTEGGFTLLFSNIIPKEILGSTMLISRSISFLLPLVVSGMVLLADAALGKIRKKRESAE